MDTYIYTHIYRYISSNTYNTLEEAVKEQNYLRSKGFKDAFIYAEKDGERITIEEAQSLKTLK